MKAIFRGGSTGPAQAARRPAITSPTSAPAFSAHLTDRPEPTEEEKLRAQKIADGEVVNVVPVKKPKMVLFISDEIVMRVVRGHEKEIALPEDIAELKRLKAIDDRFNSLILQNTDASAKVRWKKQRDGLRTYHESDELHNLPSDIWTLDDFREDAHQTRSQLKFGRRENRIKVKGIIARIHPRIAALAKAESDRLEKEETATAKEWGIHFEPSDLLKRVRYLSENAEELFPEAGANPPTSALVRIGIEITDDNDK